MEDSFKTRVDQIFGSLNKSSSSSSVNSLWCVTDHEIERKPWNRDKSKNDHDHRSELEKDLEDLDEEEEEEEEYDKVAVGKRKPEKMGSLQDTTQTTGPHSMTSTNKRVRFGPQWNASGIPSRYTFDDWTDDMDMMNLQQKKSNTLNSSRKKKTSAMGQHEPESLAFRKSSTSQKPGPKYRR